MNRFKRLSFVLCISLFAGIITFSACKKDKDNSADIGSKAAEQFCNCMTEIMNIEDLDEADMEDVECASNFNVKYGKYFNSDFDFDSEINGIDDINDFFTDADFGKAFIADLLTCQSLYEFEASTE